MLHSGHYRLDIISFKVIFEFAVPTAVVVDHMLPKPASLIEYQLAVIGIDLGDSPPDSTIQNQASGKLADRFISHYGRHWLGTHFLWAGMCFS